MKNSDTLEAPRFILGYRRLSYEGAAIFTSPNLTIHLHEYLQRLNPEQFQNCCVNWMKSVSNILKGEVVAIDGKTVRHSYDPQSGKGAIHIVSAWATENRLVLGQVKLKEKSNEITVIAELLKVLSLKKCIVTINAMGCQKEIVRQIRQEGGDYVITLKQNQGELYQRVEALFKEALVKRSQGFVFSSNPDSAKGHN